METLEPSESKVASLLLRKFKEGQLKNSRWSQRAFAQRLGVSSGALSEMMNGKRAISGSLKKKMADALQLSPLEQVEFFDDEIPAHMRPARHEHFKLSMDQFHLISDWWHYGILNLVKTKGFRPDTAWIANRIGLPHRVVAEAWDRLHRLGYLKKIGGRVVREHPRSETSDDLVDLSIRKAHVEDTKLIERSILDRSVEERDHTSVTLVMNRKNMKKAKELIRLFQDQFCEGVEIGPREQGDEVYRLSISFFPLTRNKENQ